MHDLEYFRSRQDPNHPDVPNHVKTYMQLGNLDLIGPGHIFIGDGIEKGSVITTSKASNICILDPQNPSKKLFVWGECLVFNKQTGALTVDGVVIIPDTTNNHVVIPSAERERPAQPNVYTNPNILFPASASISRVVKVSFGGPGIISIIIEGDEYLYRGSSGAAVDGGKSIFIDGVSVTENDSRLISKNGNPSPNFRR